MQQKQIKWQKNGKDSNTKSDTLTDVPHPNPFVLTFLQDDE
jgi:hypothetical protein